MTGKSDIPLWTSEDEWRLVYAWLYSSNVEMAKRGCARIQAWKARSTRQAIPFPLESTAELVECRISEATTTNNESFLQQAYAMAITRFVNGVYEYRHDQCKVKETVFVALHAMSVPSWVVVLRHSATHVAMPSLTLLKAAAEFALKWLKENYWEKQIGLISIACTDCNATNNLAYIKEMLNTHWMNFSKAMEKVGSSGKQMKRLPHVLGNMASKLVTLSKKDLTGLIHDGLFLVPNSSHFPMQLHLFQLEDPAKDQLEMFPVLHSKINWMWTRPLKVIHQQDPLFISTIVTALAEGVHDPSVSHFMSSYMAAWLGEMLGHRYLEITRAVNWEEVLKVSYTKHGTYSYAIMKRVGDKLSVLNHPFVFSDQFTLLLESTRLLSAAERILPTLKPKRSSIYAPQDKYAINVTKFAKELKEQKLKSGESDNSNLWKKSNALVNWIYVPLGLAPSQEMTGTTLELPAELDDEQIPVHNEQFTPRLGTNAVLTSPLFESAITRKRKFDQTDLSKIHTYCDTLAKL